MSKRSRFAASALLIVVSELAAQEPQVTADFTGYWNAAKEELGEQEFAERFLRLDGADRGLRAAGIPSWVAVCAVKATSVWYLPPEPEPTLSDLEAWIREHLYFCAKDALHADAVLRGESP